MPEPVMEEAMLITE
uniref:Uncharacterized protein n=1 Tax=Nymphaea colorata TaxID=210225 RepID=A0A5K1EI26_9MAGN